MTAECFTCGFPTLRRGGHAAWCWSDNPALTNVDSAFASSRADTGPASGAARFDGAAGSKPKSSWASGTCTAPVAPHRHQPAAGDAISDGPGRRETATGPTGDAQ